MDKQTQKNLLNLVKRNYEEIADDFNTSRKKYLWPELIKLASSVKDGDKVLDVGCGNGRLIEAFHEKKIEYLGVDNSKGLIRFAKKNSGSRLGGRDDGKNEDDGKEKGNDKSKKTDPGSEAGMTGENCIDKYAVADILELDKIQEKDFNYIFCIAVLHHLPGDGLRLRALEQIKNKLKPDGKIILTVWNLWSRPKFRKLIFKFGLLKLMGKNLSARLDEALAKRAGEVGKLDFGDILFDWKNSKGEKISQRYYHAFTKNNLKKLAFRAGLKIEKIYKDKYNYYLILEK